MKQNAIRIHPEDNVAIAIEPIKKGEKIHINDRGVIIAQADIIVSHKVLLVDIDTGDAIVKYGEVIGNSSQPIKKGEWIHVHNLTVSDD